MSKLNHPILEESFAIIARELDEHHFSPAEYAIARRVIHATADFEFASLLRFSPGAIASGVACLRRQVPIITDVGMVKQGVASLVARTFDNPLIAAVEQVSAALPGKTRTETGMLQCFERYPHGIYVIGNAPTALLALCTQVANSGAKPGLIVGAPVGFVSVVESKQVLAQTPVAQIRVEGRKGGSSVAAAILNALLVLAWDEQ
ncbi:MAG: cobalt-precorrin-8X methylmutase [Cyanophyceae cyanobacterium]